MGKTSDVVIAGAGIAGIATAWQVAVHLGTTSAVIVDPRPPLSLTSDRPGANYRDWWPRSSMVTLANRSIELAEGLLAAGATFAMNRRGYLYVTADRDTVDGLPGLITRHVAAGVATADADLLDRTDVMTRFRHLSPGILGAIHARRAGSLDTLGLGRVMLAVAVEHGVTVVRGEVIAGVVVAGRLAEVTVSTPVGDMAIVTDRLVNAAGPFAAEVARRLGTELPVETVMRQKVVLRDPLGVLPRDAPFTIGLDPADGLPAGVHIKPDESIASDGIKLGWAYDQMPSDPVEDPPCPPDFPRRVLERAATIVPGLSAYDESYVVAHDGGFYARTPDGLPVIGPVGPDGIHVVGGLAGFGTMMACAAGELGAMWALDEAIPDFATAFAPRRFLGTGGSVRRSPGEAPAGEL